MDKEFLTVAEVAERLRLTHVTIGRMIKSGELPAYKMRGSWRIKPGDLDAYIAGQSTQIVSQTAKALASEVLVS